MTAADVAELLDRVRRRDEAAARAMVEWLGPLVARIAAGYRPLREDTDDIVQDVFMKIFVRLDQYTGASPFDHWVSRITRFACIDRLRRKKARPELRHADLTPGEVLLLDHHADSAAGPEHSSASAHALLEKLLATLDPRDAWLLREVELRERPVAEVCLEAGWLAVSGRVRLFRARARLRRAFQKLEHHEKT